MRGGNKKIFKTLCSVLLISYTALLVIVSFHFHSISYSEISFSNAEKDFSAHTSGNIMQSDGVCQFLLTYKSNADLSCITVPKLTIYLIASKVIFTEVHYLNSHTNHNNYLRAPPLAPLALV